MAQDVLLLVTWETNQAMACPSYKDLPMRERERERERKGERNKRERERERERAKERQAKLPVQMLF